MWSVDSVYRRKLIRPSVVIGIQACCRRPSVSSNWGAERRGSTEHFDSHSVGLARNHSAPLGFRLWSNFSTFAFFQEEVNGLSQEIMHHVMIFSIIYFASQRSSSVFRIFAKLCWFLVYKFPAAKEFGRVKQSLKWDSVIPPIVMRDWVGFRPDYARWQASFWNLSWVWHNSKRGRGSIVRVRASTTCKAVQCSRIMGSCHYRIINS